jgi:hypothetical protein
VTEIRSYRSVFDLERRIYSIDRMRLNPTGVPVRAVVYFFVLAVLALFLGALPVMGAVMRLLPWYMRELAMPAAGAGILAAVRIDGRAVHLAAGSLLRLLSTPARTVAWGARSDLGRCWCPEEIVFIPDGSDSRPRRLRYVGPGSVLVLRPHRIQEAPRAIGGRVRLRRVDLRIVLDHGGKPLRKGKVLLLGPDASLRVESRRGRPL